MDASDVFRRLFISLGFITTITIGFTTLEIKEGESGVRIESRLEGAITDDIKSFILSSNRVSINYKLTIFLESKKVVYRDRRSVLYSSLQDEFILTGSGDNIGVKEFSDVRDFLTTPLFYPVKEGRLAVLEASLDIEGIDDEVILSDLWAGIEPRISEKFKE